jgi:TfoX/Sxy family transcriptional regulator of competence genes
MSSRQETADYIVEQMARAGEMRSRKMFGEYAVYCDDKVIAFICDDELFLKPTPPGRALLPEGEEGAPYPGAKMYLVVSADMWDDAEFMSDLARSTADALPAPKQRKR